MCPGTVVFLEGNGSVVWGPGCLEFLGSVANTREPPLAGFLQKQEERLYRSSSKMAEQTPTGDEPYECMECFWNEVECFINELLKLKTYGSSLPARNVKYYVLLRVSENCCILTRSLKLICNVARQFALSHYMLLSHYGLQCVNIGAVISF
jgi:hypothetical protein